MSKELYVTSTPHETKLAIVEDDRAVEVYFERENEYTLAGSIYKGRVTRVLPGMQSAFVDIGLERDAFLYVTDFLEQVEDDDTEPVTEKPRERGRDRDRDRERQPRQQQSAPPRADVVPEAQFEGDFTGEESAPDQPQLAGGDETGQRGEENQSEERDGARRWRGRRGRRGRGRGRDRERPEASPEQAAAPQETAEATENDLPLEAAPSVAEPEEPQAPAPSSRKPSEASFLPGESLRKYGRQEEPHTAEPVKPVAPKSSIRPSTEVTDPAAFMAAGRGILAGETIRKYKNQPAETVAVPSHAGPDEEREEDDFQSGGEVVVHPELHNEAPERQAEARVEEPVVETATVAAPPRRKRITEEFELPNLNPEVSSAHARTFGEGVVEEEEISDDEQDISHFGEHLEDSDLEELEEETLEEDPSVRKEEEMIAAGERLAAAFAETRRGNGEAESYMEEDLEEEEEEDEDEGEEIAADGEEAEVLADAADEGEDDGGEEEADPEDPNYSGRAEMRASSGTAGFQQRAERTSERGDRGDRSRGGRGGRNRRIRRVRRRNIPRGPVPQISEVLKEGQEILIQIAKEPIAKKGARITSHIALPGRFLVFMPTVNHTGVSRKIGSDEERQRLKRILLSEKGDAHGGFIVRTAAAGASEDDLRADIRFLINLWGEIKQRSDSGKAPALIYHDLNLVERILRDQVTESFSQIWVDTEQEYERILRFAQRFQPGLIKRVKLYTKETPLFEEFGVADEINKALKSKVWLKSGGYIVINQTEALVAIDINTGKYVGKTGRLEDTIVKTNIDAIQEIVRQIRLRDLGGIIIIDFIDMDERRNRQKVMQALEEALKNDRSPSKVLQFNDFGLVAITRKRVKQSLERTLSTSCTYCTGTGMIKSVATVCNEIYVEMRKMNKHIESHQVMLRVNPEVAKALKENSGRWLMEMEELLGRSIIVKSDPSQHQEQFDIQ